MPNLTLSRPAAQAAVVKSADAGKIDSLTSLRFFAATAIVLLHFSSMVCPELWQHVQKLALHQGVSFFYVLSGFILTYVYPDLNSIKAVGKFLRARFARVYPVHLFAMMCAVTMVCLFSGMRHSQFTKLLACNLLLIQDWIPMQGYYWSMNAPAWSISCEFFFYLCFPFLIQQFARTWKIKFIAVTAVTLFLVWLPSVLKLAPTPGPYEINREWFTALCPLTRLWEFTLGMCTALLYTKKPQTGSHVASALSTCREALLVAATIMYFWVPNVFPYVQRHWHTLFALIPIQAYDWIATSAGAPVYAALIYYFAQERGWLSKTLSDRRFVLLGEISFAMYLIHCPVITFINVNAANLSIYPRPLIYACYWIFVLCASLVVFELIEKPGRSLILGRAMTAPRFTCQFLAAISALFIISAGCTPAVIKSIHSVVVARVEMQHLLQ